MEDNKDKKVFDGQVAWFDPRKGYGFIARDDGGRDIFVHYSDISMEGFKVVMAGDRVTFEESYNYKEKLKACNVVMMGRKNEKPE
ncbi:MAG TPA: cold shock domain-containing protein [Candidatus Glassbacteria bacterium]|nr:cold shock domain-containing protein [Candidatus Glassbacteria bacterium]